MYGLASGFHVLFRLFRIRVSDGLSPGPLISEH